MKIEKISKPEALNICASLHYDSKLGGIYSSSILKVIGYHVIPFHLHSFKFIWQ